MAVGPAGMRRAKTAAGSSSPGGGSADTNTASRRARPRQAHTLFDETVGTAAAQYDVEAVKLGHERYARARLKYEKIESAQGLFALRMRSAFSSIAHLLILMLKHLQTSQKIRRCRGDNPLYSVSLPTISGNVQYCISFTIYSIRIPNLTGYPLNHC
jgi:hypothetical protein